MNAPAPDWRDKAVNTPGARLAVWCDADTLARAYIQEKPDGSLEAQLSTGERLPPEQLRDRLAGPLRQGQDDALTRRGPTFTPADLWMVTAGDSDWRRDSDLFGFAPGRQQSQVAQCSSEQVRLLARNPMFSVFTYITDRPEDDVMSPGFFSPIADQLERHSQIWTTCSADTSTPVYLRLVVDVVRHLDRVVVCRVLERLEPACPQLRPPATAAAAAPVRDAAGRFQRRSDVA